MRSRCEGRERIIQQHSPSSGMMTLMRSPPGNHRTAVAGGEAGFHYPRTRSSLAFHGLYLRIQLFGFSGKLSVQPDVALALGLHGRLEFGVVLLVEFLAGV